MTGRVRGCRLALGGVAHCPAAARPRRLTSSAARSRRTWAADAELAEAQPLPRNGYKVTLARNLIVATLQELLP